VVDSSSTDRTAAIAAKAGARVINFTWNGQFPKKRNWFLDHGAPRNDWCLFLDADEVVTPEFVAEVRQALAEPGKVGFWLHYTNYFLGQPLRHGVQQRKLALFRRSCGRYERIAEDRWSQLDMEVHEHPQLEGETGSIAARIDHRDFRGLDRFIIRHVDYARWEQGRHALLRGDADAVLTPRQRTKYAHITRWWYPLAYFLFNYIAKGGFRDGGAGLQYSFYKMWYFNTIRLLIRQAERERGAG
jgi:glycosyltransferase involved in cell wall biosynthesis